jgi:CHAT domain-containing protein/tetratricopeptide (TPR) repeat protein
MTCSNILQVPGVLILLVTLTGISVSVLAQTTRPNITDPIEILASELTSSKSEEERTALLSAKKELITINLRKALVQRGNILLTAGQYAKAFEVYGIAKRVAEQLGDKEGIAVASLDIGTVYYFQANYPAAFDHYKQARELFVQIGNNYEAAKALSGLALIQKERQRDSEALKSFEQVFKEFEALNDKEEMANAMSSIGTIYYGQRKYPEATRAFLKSTELNSSADNTVRIADAFYMQGDYGEASNYYKKSLAGFYERNDVAGVISALGGAANSAYYQGNYDEALEYFQKNLSVQEKEHDQFGMTSSLRGIGNVHRSRSDFGAALENYEKGVALSEEIKAPRGTLLGSIGLVRYLQGENDQALDYYRKSLAEFEATDNKIDMARALSLMGNAFYAQQNYESALESYRKSLVLREAMEDKPGQGDLMVGIGTVNLRKRSYPEALDSYQRALSLFESVDHKSAIANVLSKIADTYLLQRNYQESLSFAERAATLARQVENNDVWWYARMLSGKAQRSLDHQAEAIRSFTEAIAIVESLRSRPASSEAGVERSGVLPYLAAVDLLVEQNRAAEAFDYAERAKVQSLIELLRRSNAQSVKGMSAAEQVAERKLAGDVVSIELQLDREAVSPTSNETRRASLRDRLHQARSAYGGFRQALYLKHPSLRVERGELAALKIEHLRPLITDGRTALLEYVITEANVYLFVLSADETNRKIGGNRSRSVISLKAYPLEINREGLGQRVTSLYELLITRDESFAAATRELYDLLIKPAADQLAGKTKLVIVPDGILWRLPFETLQPAQDRYLLDQASTSYAPSLSTWREMIRRPVSRVKSTALLAFANPQLSKELLKRVELTYKGVKLEPSPAQDVEIQRLKSVYGDAQSRTLTGANASEERAKTEITRARILHFAVPAILDDISPMYSFIALSSTGGNNLNDGLLQTREIMNLQTQARMVVLSAAGVRNDRNGAGAAAIGLAWSWFVAGSPSTVFSRWEVKSPSAAQLMADFHSRLRSGSRNQISKASALQRSMLTLRHSTGFQHPYYWAAFSLIGDGR